MEDNLVDVQFDEDIDFGDEDDVEVDEQSTSENDDISDLISAHDAEVGTSAEAQSVASSSNTAVAAQKHERKHSSSSELQPKVEHLPNATTPQQSHGEPSSETVSGICTLGTLSVDIFQNISTLKMNHREKYAGGSGLKQRGNLKSVREATPNLLFLISPAQKVNALWEVN